MMPLDENECEDDVRIKEEVEGEKGDEINPDTCGLTPYLSLWMN